MLGATGVVTVPDSDHRGGNGDEGLDALSLLLFAHLAVAADADRALAATGLNRTHHRILFLIALKPGITVGEIVGLLRVTAQAIQSPLRTLIDDALIQQQSSKRDRRRRNLVLTERGRTFLNTLSGAQYTRIAKAVGSVGKRQRQGFFDVMRGMMDEHDRDWLYPSGRQVALLSSTRDRAGPPRSIVAGEGAPRKARARRP